MQKPMRLKSYGGLVALLLGLISFFGFAERASAQTNLVCTAARAVDWRVDFGNVVDNPNIADGGVIATGRVTTANATITCANLPNNTNAWNRVVLRGLTETGYVWAGQYVRFLYNGRVVSDAVLATYTSPGTYTVNGAGITAQLIKRSNQALGPGACGAQRGSAFIMNGVTEVVGSNVGNVSLCATSFTRLVPTCTVNTTSITIPLGNVAASSLASVGSVSTTTGPQNIGLSCTYAPNIRMTLQGTRIGTTTAVALTGAGTAGVAGGVGVQVLYRTPGTTTGTNLLTPGTGVTIVSRAGATVTVPIFARYYRTGAVTAGRANAAPTLLFDYP